MTEQVTSVSPLGSHKLAELRAAIAELITEYKCDETVDTYAALKTPNFSDVVKLRERRVMESLLSDLQAEACIKETAQKSAFNTVYSHKIYAIPKVNIKRLKELLKGEWND